MTSRTNKYRLLPQSPAPQLQIYWCSTDSRRLHRLLCWESSIIIQTLQPGPGWVLIDLLTLRSAQTVSMEMAQRLLCHFLDSRSTKSVIESGSVKERNDSK